MASDGDEDQGLWAFPKKSRIGNIYHPDVNKPGVATRKVGKRGEYYCEVCGVLIPPDGRESPHKCRACLSPSSPHHKPAPKQPEPPAKPAAIPFTVISLERGIVTETLFRQDPLQAFRILMGQASRAKTPGALCQVRQRLKYFLERLEKRGGGA